MSMSVVYLIPTFLADDAVETIPIYTLTHLKSCKYIFAENIRTARRFLKSMDKSINIDEFIWFEIGKVENELKQHFINAIQTSNNIAIISEAGCPGVADPGQELIAIAQERNCMVKPLVGPNSTLLALMASGMNGQQFEFCGYLPIDNSARVKKIKELEAQSLKFNSTKIFIETPYRNDQLFDALVNNCGSNTRLCVAINITSPGEKIRTMSIKEWKFNKPILHKIPVIFLLHGS